MKKRVAKRAWPLFSGAVVWITGAAVQRALASGWRRARDSDPPTPRGDAPLLVTATYTAATTALSATAAVLAAHGAEVAWKRLTGSKPPRKK